MHPFMKLQRAVSLKLLENIHQGVINRTAGCTVKIEVLFLAVPEFMKTAVQLQISQ